MTTLVIHPPWSDPQLLSRAEIIYQDESHRIDLNLGFRSHLVSSGFLTGVRRITLRELEEINARPQLRGRPLWSLYRRVRLAASIKALSDFRTRDRQEALEEYFHSLATGENWYFTAQIAYPHTPGTGAYFARQNALGSIGEHFLNYIEGIGLSRRAQGYSEVLISIDDNGQLPFAFLLARSLSSHLRGDELSIVIDLGPMIDRRLVRAFQAESPSIRIQGNHGKSGVLPRLSAAKLRQLARCSRQSLSRRHSVLWQFGSRTRMASTLTRCVKELTGRGIRVALVCSPSVGADDSEAQVNDLFFRALDQILSLQDSLAAVRVDARTDANATASLATELNQWSRDQELTSILEVQLQAELDNRSLVTHRLPRKLLNKNTRLVASTSLPIRSHFNLSDIFEHFDLGKASRPFRCGRGIPRTQTPVYRRAPRPEKYLIATGFPLAVPILRDNATYSDAFSYFSNPRSVAAFIARYRAPDRERLFDFLDDSVANGAFRAL